MSSHHYPLRSTRHPREARFTDINHSLLVVLWSITNSVALKSMSVMSKIVTAVTFGKDEQVAYRRFSVCYWGQQASSTVAIHALHVGGKAHNVIPQHNAERAHPC